MIPERYAPRIFAVFRMVFGLMFLSHGLKTVGYVRGLAFGGQLPPLTSEPGIAGVLELVLGSLIMAAVHADCCIRRERRNGSRVLQGHQRMALWPLENQGELAVLFCSRFSTCRAGR